MMLFWSMLYVACGFLSATIFVSTKFTDDYPVNGIFSGIPFIALTILMLCVKYKKKPVRVIKYAGLIYLTYLILYFATLHSAFFGLLVGAFTGAIGAWITFALFNTFEFGVKLKNGWEIILSGAMPFLLLNLFLHLGLEKVFTYYYLVEAPFIVLLSTVYLIWQSLVGYQLVKHLSAAEA